MTIRVAPAVGLVPTQPSLGIFWRVAGVLVIDRSVLEDCEPYGECLTHPVGHYERWENWRALGVERLRAAGFPDRIAWTEYDEWPRGLIVYEKQAKRFILYADRRLQTPSLIDALKTAFGLHEGEVIIMNDAHYR